MSGPGTGASDESDSLPDPGLHPARVRGIPATRTPTGQRTGGDEYRERQRHAVEPTRSMPRPHAGTQRSLGPSDTAETRGARQADRISTPRGLPLRDEAPDSAGRHWRTFFGGTSYQGVLLQGQQGKCGVCRPRMGTGAVARAVNDVSRETKGSHGGQYKWCGPFVVNRVVRIR